MYDWRTGRSCVFKNHAHLVFVTKYRREVFTAEMLERTKSIIAETCEQMDCELLEFSGEHNHIHLMVAIHPVHAASRVLGPDKDDAMEQPFLVSQLLRCVVRRRYVGGDKAVHQGAKRPAERTGRAAV